MSSNREDKVYWVPHSDKDHIVELHPVSGEPLRVIKGTKSIRELLENHFDKEQTEGRISSQERQNYRSHYKLDR